MRSSIFLRPRKGLIYIMLCHFPLALALSLTLAIRLSVDAAIPVNLDAVCSSDTLDRLSSASWDDLARDKTILDTLLSQILGAEAIGTTATTGRVFNLSPDGPRCLAFGATTDRPPGIIILIFIFEARNNLSFQCLPTFYGDTQGDIRDIDADGTLEVITHHDLTASAEPVLWPTVFRFVDRAYVESSRNFQPYYREYLQQITSRIKSLDALVPATEAQQSERPRGKTAESNQARREYLMVAQFLAQQVLGQKKAGLAQAVEWARSDQAPERQRAIKVLSSIDDPQSLIELERLSRHDPDPLISQLARAALQRLTENRSPSNIE